MTPETDIVPTPQSQILTQAAHGHSPKGLAAPLDLDAGAASLFAEINERRARIENPELLRHLRGL